MKWKRKTPKLDITLALKGNEQRTFLLSFVPLPQKIKSSQLRIDKAMRNG